MFNGFKDPSNCYGSQPLYENCNQGTFLPCDGTKQTVSWDYAASSNYNGMAPYYGEQALNHHPHSRLGSALLHGGGPPMPPPTSHAVSHDRKGGGGGGATNAAEASNMLIQHYNNGAAVAGAAATATGPHHASVVRPTAVINCQSRRSGPCCSNHPGRVPQPAPSVPWGSTATAAAPPPHGTSSDAPGVVQRYLNEAGAPSQSFLHDEAARFRPPPDFTSLSKLTRYASRDNTSDAAADPVAAKTALKSLEACALRPSAGGGGAQGVGGTGMTTGPKRDAGGNRGSCLYEGAPPVLAELTPVVPDAAMDVQGDPSGLLCYSGTSCVPPPHPQWPAAARSQNDAAAAWLHPATGAWGDPTWQERNGGGGYPEYARYHHAPPPYHHQSTQHIPQQAQHRKVAHHEASAVASARMRTTGSSRRQPDAYVSYGGVPTHGVGGAPKGMESFTTGIAQPPTRFSPHMTYTQSKISRTANEALLGAAQQYDGSFSYGTGYTAERLAPNANATGVYPGTALNMTRKNNVPALQQHSQSHARVSDVIRFGTNGMEPFPGGGGAGTYGAGSYAGLQAGCARLMDEAAYAPPSMQQMLDFAASTSLPGSQRHLQNHALPPMSRPGTLFQSNQPQHAPPPSHTSHIVGDMQRDGCMYARPPMPAAPTYTPVAPPAPPAPDRKPKQKTRVLDVRHFLATWDEENEDLAPTPAPPPVYDVEDCTPATPTAPPTPAPALITVTDDTPTSTIPVTVSMNVEQAPSMPDISPPHESQEPETTSEVQEATEDLLEELMAVARPRTPSTVIVASAAEVTPSPSSPPPPLLPAAIASSSAPPTRATSAPPPPPATVAHSPAAARAASAPFVYSFSPEEEYFRLRDLTGLVSSSSDSEPDEEPEPRTASGVSVIQHGGPSRTASPLVDSTALGLTNLYNSNENIGERKDGNDGVDSVKSCSLDTLQSPSPPPTTLPSSNNLPDVVPCPPEGIAVADGEKKNVTSMPKTQEKKCISEEGLVTNLPEVVAPEVNDVLIENLVDHSTKSSPLFCHERIVESNSSPREHKTLSPVVIDQNGNYSPKFPRIDTKVNSYQSSEEKSGGAVVKEIEPSRWPRREGESMKNSSGQGAQEKTLDSKNCLRDFPEITEGNTRPRSVSPQKLTAVPDRPALSSFREVIKTTDDISINYQGSQQGVPVDLSSSTRTEWTLNDGPIASGVGESDSYRERVEVKNIAAKESLTVITDGSDVRRNLIREINIKELIKSSEVISVVSRGYKEMEIDCIDQIVNCSSNSNEIVVRKEVDAFHPNMTKKETTSSVPVEMMDDEVVTDSIKSSEEISIACVGAKEQGQEDKEVEVYIPTGAQDLPNTPSNECRVLTSANSNLECAKSSNTPPTTPETCFVKEDDTETSEQLLHKEERDNEKADYLSGEESQPHDVTQKDESITISEKEMTDAIQFTEEHIEVQNVNKNRELDNQNKDRGAEDCSIMNITGECMDAMEDNVSIVEQNAMLLDTEKIEEDKRIIADVQSDTEVANNNVDEHSDEVCIEKEVEDNLDETKKTETCVSRNHVTDVQDNQRNNEISVINNATNNSDESVLLSLEDTESVDVNCHEDQKKDEVSRVCDSLALPPSPSEPLLSENMEVSLPTNLSLSQGERKKLTDVEMPDLELGASNASMAGPPTEMPTLESMAMPSSTPPPPLQPLSPSPYASPCVRSRSSSHSPHRSKTPPSSPMYVESPAGARALEHLRCPSPPTSPGPLSPFASRSCAFKNPSAPSSPLDLRYSSTPRSPPASRIPFNSKSPSSPQTFVLEPTVCSPRPLEISQVRRRECASPTDSESSLPVLPDVQKSNSTSPFIERHFSPKEHYFPKSLDTSGSSSIRSANSPSTSECFPSSVSVIFTSVSRTHSETSISKPCSLTSPRRATEVPTFSTDSSPKHPTSHSQMNSPCRTTEIQTLDFSSKSPPRSANKMNSLTITSEITNFTSNSSPKSPLISHTKLNSPRGDAEIRSFPSDVSPKSPPRSPKKMNSLSGATEISKFSSDCSPKDTPLSPKMTSDSEETLNPTFPSNCSLRYSPSSSSNMKSPRRDTETSMFSPNSPKSSPRSSNGMSSPSGAAEIPTLPTDSSLKSSKRSPNSYSGPTENTTFLSKCSPKSPPSSPTKMKSPCRTSESLTFPADCSPQTSASPNERNSPRTSPEFSTLASDSKSPDTSVSIGVDSPVLKPAIELPVRETKSDSEVSPKDISDSLESGFSEANCSQHTQSSQPSITPEASKVISVPTSVLVLAPSMQYECFSSHVSEKEVPIDESQSSEMTEETVISNARENDEMHPDGDGPPEEARTVIQEVCMVETTEGESEGPAFTLVGAPEDVAVAACALLEIEDATVFGDSASDPESHAKDGDISDHGESNDINSKDARAEEDALKTEETETAAPLDSSCKTLPCSSVPPSPNTPSSIEPSENAAELVLTPTSAAQQHDPWSSGFGPQPFVSGGRSPASVEMLPADTVANWPYPEEEVVCWDASGPEDGMVASANTPTPPLHRTSSACSRSSGSGSDTSLKCRLSWKKIFAFSRGGRGGGVQGPPRRRGRPRKRSRGRRGRPPLLASLPPTPSPLPPPPDEPGGSERAGSNAAWQVVDATGSAPEGATGQTGDASPGGTPAVPVVLVRRLVLRCDRSSAREGAGAVDASCSSSECASVASVTPMPSSSEDEGDDVGELATKTLSTANETCTTARSTGTPGMTPLVSPASKSPSSSCGDTATPRTPRILIRRSGGDEYRSFLRGEEARWQPVVVIPRSVVLDQVARKLAARPLSIRLRFASADPLPPPKPPPLQPSCVAAASPLATAPVAEAPAATVGTPAPSPPHPAEAPSAARATKDYASTLCKDDTKELSFPKREATSDASSQPLKKVRKRRSSDPANRPRARKRPSVVGSGGEREEDEGGGEPMLAGVVVAAPLPAKRRCSEPAPASLPYFSPPSAAAVPDDDDSDGEGAGKEMEEKENGEEEEDAEASGGDGGVKCAACEHSFTDAGDRAVHVRQHRYHCQRCDLAFRSQAEFVAHLGTRHPSTRERHHCLLCARSYASAERHALHVRGRLHRALEGLQRRTVHALFSLLTGRVCPGIAPLDAAERAALRWLPAEPGAVHFYHQATPLQMAIQDWTRRQQTEVASAPPVPLGEAEAL